MEIPALFQLVGYRFDPTSIQLPLLHRILISTPISKHSSQEISGQEYFETIWAWDSRLPSVEFFWEAFILL